MLLRLVSVLGGGWCGWLVGENNLRKEKPEGARFKDET